MINEFTQTGGARFGSSYLFSINYTLPFAEIVVSKDAILLKASAFGFLSSEYKFERDEVDVVTECRGVFSRGVRIYRTKDCCPEYIIFWTTNRPKLIEALKEFGYHVEQG